MGVFWASGLPISHNGQQDVICARIQGQFWQSNLETWRAQPPLGLCVERMEQQPLERKTSVCLLIHPPADHRRAASVLCLASVLMGCRLVFASLSLALQTSFYCV